jgi:hypothetical protein
MTLLTLLTVVSSVVVFTGAVQAASEVVGPPVVRYAVGIALGLVLAAVNAWTVARLGMSLGRSTSSWSESRQAWCGRGFTAAMTCWIFAGGFLAAEVAATAIRLVLGTPR